MASNNIRIHIKSASNLLDKDVIGKSDPFVIVYLNGKIVAQTKVRKFEFVVVFLFFLFSFFFFLFLILSFLTFSYPHKGHQK
jgi:hypothetical protein